MSVSNDVYNQVRDRQNRADSPETGPLPESTTRRLADAIVRTDHSGARGPARPKSLVSFSDYVDWLQGDGELRVEEPEPIKPEPSLPEPRQSGSDVTESPSRAPVVVEGGLEQEVAETGSDHGSIVVSSDIGFDFSQTVVVDSLGAVELPKIVRRDSEHAKLGGAKLPAPHMLVDEVMADLGRTIDDGDVAGFFPVGAEPLEAIVSGHANWEVPDFRWPAAIEAITEQQPKLARLLLNQSTRFIRPDRRRLVVAGNGRHQGTSFLSMGIARWAAMAGQRVLLVDADLANPELGSSLGIDDDCEISWLLTVANREPVADAIIQSEATGVCLLPLKTERRPQWGSVALLDMLGTLVSSIQNDFDLVIIDAGSAKQLLNSLSQSSALVDSTLLVHQGGQSDSLLFHKTCSRLNDFGIEKVVVAENCSDSNSSKR